MAQEGAVGGVADKVSVDVLRENWRRLSVPYAMDPQCRVLFNVVHSALEYTTCTLLVPGTNVGLLVA